MGPRSVERGNHIDVIPYIVGGHKLQWGRVRLNAEMLYQVGFGYLTKSFNGAAFG